MILAVIPLALSVYAQSIGPALTGAVAASAPVPTVTYVTSNANTAGGSYASIAVALSGGNAGDLIACAVQWSNGAASVSGISDGTSSLTALSQVSDPNGNLGQNFYLLSANGASKTYTATFSGALGGNPEIACFDFHASSGSWHFDAYATAANPSGGSSSVSVGPITTTGSAEALIFSGKLSTTAATTSNPLINGATPSQPSWSPINTYDHYYYSILTTPASSLTASKTYSTNTLWVAQLGAWYAS